MVIQLNRAVYWNRQQIECPAFQGWEGQKDVWIVQSATHANIWFVQITISGKKVLDWWGTIEEISGYLWVRHNIELRFFHEGYDAEAEHGRSEWARQIADGQKLWRQVTDD